MTYLVQVWEEAKGEWWTVHKLPNPASAETSARILLYTCNESVRVLAKPSIMDVLDMLHELEQSGLVDVRLVDTEWRWTVREGVK